MTDGVSPALPGAVERLRISPYRGWLVLLLDGVIASLALWVALLLRFEGVLPPEQWAVLPRVAFMLAACRIAANILLRLHRWSFRFSGLVDAGRVWVGALLGTGLFTMALYLLALSSRPPRSVILIELLLSGVAMTALRFSPRLAAAYVGEQVRARGRGVRRALIVGAGSAGELLLRDLNRSNEHAYTVVGFLDDDPGKQGMVVGGKAVLGTIDELPRVARQCRAAMVLIAIPRLEAARVRGLLSLCADLKLQFKILPVSFAYLNDRVSASMLQELSPEDLLPREAVKLTDANGRLAMAERTALVTGAAGSIGAEICRQLLAAGVRRLAMVDMNENGLYMLRRRFERDFRGACVRVDVVDVRDQGRVKAVMERYRPRDVFHAAAHKHVPLMEWAPGEAIKNNVLGTLYLARAADACGVERFVYISTDKAVRPTSVMGVSKRVGEKICRYLADRSRTQFVAVRFGNVLGSAGSVVPLFREQIAAGGPVTVTDPEVRRFFMTIDEAVGLVLQAAYADAGSLYVLDMGEQIRIVDLARHMITMSGQVPEEDIKIEFSGLRPGEKLFEELLTEEKEELEAMARKIHVVRARPVRGDLLDRVAELAEAAAGEDGERVVALLQALVPSFTPERRVVVAGWERCNGGAAPPVPATGADATVDDEVAAGKAGEVPESA